ncbi:MAG: D-tyrosyl-tRNA(Tyr) deacylase [Candidatus Magasanikbacteria bacterium RIFCSPHIGHO2_02_FULL_41_13]|uniref:D-aminoacyl-tRNA deacylase n=1 Tax=Candidatus Magasanikbacteria bacterium RIFCSPHIGHO2_02_FULL_41_13 TaxID=1798676 RepID=A0A1F6M650_9BACT|nr:MAG: D-tyrosyl-tRNA(Tyr) deacylase [Candidatus Magasanikbacteria bacterium RIFCSPHIGHO2_02_FULL_41_13]
MKVVLQKVRSSEVKVENKTVGQIGHGFLLLLGVTHEDTESSADWLVEKILKLRLFSDPGSDSFMEKNIVEVGGSLLVVSQFTLYGDCRKGTKPSFTDAARPEQAEKLYNYFVEKLRSTQIKVETGIFAAHMEVSLVNDGPITLLLDSKTTTL